SDLPLRDLEIEVLPPVDENERPKGMAEVVMIPVVPALLNAIYDATGHRFQSLPVTQAMIKGSINLLSRFQVKARPFLTSAMEQPRGVRHSARMSAFGTKRRFVVTHQFGRSLRQRGHAAAAVTGPKRRG